MLAVTDIEGVEESESEGAALGVSCDERDALPQFETLGDPLGDGVEAFEGGVVGPNEGTLEGETDNDASSVGVSGRDAPDAAADCEAELVAEWLPVYETVPHVDMVDVSDMLTEGTADGETERSGVVVSDAA